PGIEAGRVAELAEVLPDVQQSLLRRVLGEVDVAQEPVGHREKPIREGMDQVGKRLLIAALCTSHEIGVHAPPQGGPRRIAPTLQPVWAPGCWFSPMPRESGRSAAPAAPRAPLPAEA